MLIFLFTTYLIILFLLVQIIDSSLAQVQLFNTQADWVPGENI